MQGFAFLIAYGLSTFFLMVINTSVLDLGDPKFGRDSWDIYFPVWCLFYSPVALFCCYKLTVMEKGRKRKLAFFTFLFSILVVMELSIFLDIHYVWLITENLLLIAAFQAFVSICTRDRGACSSLK